LAARLEIVVAIVCITALGITYFIVIRQDSSVLVSLSSIIGGLVGYAAGRARARRR
jgi:hypothetical protein